MSKSNLFRKFKRPAGICSAGCFSLDFSTKSYYNCIWYDFVLIPMHIASLIVIMHKQKALHRLSSNQKGTNMNIHSSKELKRYNYLVSEIDAAYHEISSKLGLPDSSMIVLYTICDSGDSCLLRDIVHNSGISKQTVNSALRKLEAEGIIYLEHAGAKNKSVCLTIKGKKLADRTARRIIDIENDIFASWSSEDMNKYLELTERYLLDFKDRLRQLEQKPGET